MRFLYCSFLCALLVSLTACAEEETLMYYRDIYPDTWVATDGLGRTMPDCGEAGPVKKDQRRIVGMFYITWHGDHLHHKKSPYSSDVTRVLEGDPAARFDGKHPLWKDNFYHWGEPEMGYFLSKDEWVIRKDISMLSDAGVDVLIMDVTNAVRYWEEWEVVFSTLEKMKAEGNKVPYFTFWSFNGPAIVVVRDLYDRIYKEEKYKDLWFYWDGKPLLLYNSTPSVDANGSDIKNPNPNYDPAAATDPAHPHYQDPEYTEEFYTDYPQEIRDFFTLRTMWWGYYEWAGKRAVGAEDYWSFGYQLNDEKVRALDPADLLSTHNGKPEQAAVTPAQHSNSMTGKCWTRENFEPSLNEYDMPVPSFVPWLGETVAHPEDYGIYFQQRWDEILPQNPQFLYINDWNEWTAGKYHPEEGHTVQFLGRENNYFFVDQYNAEFNRTIQPMKGGYTDNYYMQMAQNLRKYKGVRPIPQQQGISRINVDGDFSDWDPIRIEYRDTIGDTFHRNYKGYGGLVYVNESGRNDIITSKVAVSEESLCFYVETKEEMTVHSDPNWMLLLIDADQDSSTGWYGYDFLINKEILSDEKTTVKSYTGICPDGRWETVAEIPFRYTGKEMELAVPRALLGLGDAAFSFDMKWSDNPAELKDPISLCTDGDTAPNRRFNYRVIWKN